MAQAAEKAPDGQSFSTGYEYDGETTAAGCGSAPTTVKYHEYDGIGRVKQSRREMAGGGPWQFAYSYNHQGLISMTYPSGRVVTTAYDNGGRPNSVANYVTNVTYHAHGAPDQTTLANTLVETAVYNNRLQPTQITAGSLLNLSFSYGTGNNNGNVLSQTIAGLGVTQTYTYDFVNRTSSASETGAGTPWSQSYSYTTDGSDGRFGNLSQTGDGLSGGLNCTTYDNNNHCNASGFGYDDAGNLTAYANRTLAYDAEDRQTTLSDGGSYEYDGEGRRVKKIAGGVTTMYVYDAFGKLAAEYATSAPAHQPECARCYLTPDHLGSTRLVTDETGAVKRRYDYHPFGGEINPGYGNRNSVAGYAATDEFNLKFTGKERDYEPGRGFGLGLDYFGARYYSSAQGRFTSPDEFTGGIVDAYTGGQVQQPGALPYADITDPQTLNKYAYVRNNPLRFVDPDGHCPWCIGALLGGGIGMGTQILADLATDQPIAWRKTLAAGVGGAIVAGTAGAASELGLAVQIAIVGDAGVVGGITERAIKSGSLDKATANPAEIGKDFGFNALAQGASKALEAVVTKLAGGAVENLTGQLERARTPNRTQKIESRLEAAKESLQLRKTAATAAADSAREAGMRVQQQQRKCTAGESDCQQ